VGGEEVTGGEDEERRGEGMKKEGQVKTNRPGWEKGEGECYRRRRGLERRGTNEERRDGSRSEGGGIFSGG